MWKNVYLIRITNEAYKDLHGLKKTFLFFCFFVFFLFFCFLRGTTVVSHHFPEHLAQFLIEQLVLSFEVIVDDVFELLHGDALFLDVIELCLALKAGSIMTSSSFINHPSTDW